MEAQVNLTPVLEGMSRDEVEVGSWVNVIGTIDTPADGISAANRVSRPRRHEQSNVNVVYINAVMLWSAGSINLSNYEDTVAAREAFKG